MKTTRFGWIIASGTVGSLALLGLWLIPGPKPAGAEKKAPESSSPTTGLGDGATPQRTDTIDLVRQAELVIGQAVQDKREGDTESAVKLLLTLVSEAFPPSVRADARRHLGQIAWAAGDVEGAKAHFREVLLLVEGVEVLEGVGPTSAAGSLNQLFVILLNEKNLEEALRANTALLGLGSNALASDILRTANGHQALVLTQMGRAKEAIPYASTVVEMTRDTPEQEHYLHALHQLATAEEAIGEHGSAASSLSRAWDVVVARPDLAISGTALRLHSAMQASGDGAAASVFAKTAFDTLSSQGAQRRALDPGISSAEMSLLSSLCGAHAFGRPDLSMWAYDQIEMRVQGDANALATIKKMRSDLIVVLEDQGRK